MKKIKEKETRKKIVDLKKHFLTFIGYFYHTNLVVSFIIGVLINLFIGFVTIGFFYLIKKDLIKVNFLSALLMFAVFSVIEFIVKIIFYKTSYKLINESSGLFMYPINLLTFYSLSFLPNVKYLNAISILLVASLFMIIRYVFVKFVYIKLFIDKKSQKEWIPWVKKELKLDN